MATKDERPGLLSKVALFVRNPTKDWSELEQMGQPQEMGYDKQALKAMIERKRQNDFVRKREFDQLRKLRNRDPSAIASTARPSFFQTSLPTDPDGRAITLKKIDEIEAQMSKQWWKGKHEPTQPHDLTKALPRASEADPAMSGSQLPAQSVHDSSEPFESTEAVSLTGGADAISQPNEFASTQMASSAIPQDRRDARGASAESNAVAAGFGLDDVGFSTSRLFAIEVGEMATDPELEEAAIRFANSDDAGAEDCLLTALRGLQLQPEAAQSWAAALMDFYRATSNRPAFDAAIREFTVHLDGAIPVWVNLSELGGTAMPNAHSAPAGHRVTWSSPALLNLSDMESLRDAMAVQAMPWHINWTGLDTIAPGAMELLDGLFSSLCEEPVQLQFSGSEQVARALRNITPSGDRNIPTAWWHTRLNALRTMQRLDDFELAALDYCITYEVSPPAWAAARCQFIDLELAGASAGGQMFAFEDAANTLKESADKLPRLHGEVLGDASTLLEAFETFDVPGTKLVIDCSGLLRVDFSAAGSILNWVAIRQAQGNFVQFHNAHRLVAAFFNVIGINEHAKVIPRAI